MIAVFAIRRRRVEPANYQHWAVIDLSHPLPGMLIMPHTTTAKMNFRDQLITQFDRALRSVTPGTQATNRPSPAEQQQEQPLTAEEKRHAAGLMRVNHAGEVCAQALYQGQALTAKLTRVRADMERAADEEVDHLAWCEKRLAELNSHTSVLNPLWYGLSFGLGAGAGLINDKISLGFVAATEDQVCRHLQCHLNQLPEHDAKSRAVVSSMIHDEQQHGASAIKAGGYVFPKPVKFVMSCVAKAMTTSSYRV